MQGQKGAFGSFSETFFDQGSTSSNATIEQQVCWNNIQNPIENRFPDCLPSHNDINIGYVNSISREEQEPGRWSLEEPSSSGTQNEVNHNERKVDHVWSSSMSASVTAEKNSPFVQNSNSNTVSRSLNLNAAIVAHGNNNCQVMDRSNLYNPSGSERDLISSAAGPEGFRLSSRSSGYVGDDNDNRPGDGRRASCKRKALEGNVGQSSSSGSSSYFHCAESSAGHGVSASSSVGNGMNISASSGQAHPRLGLEVGGSGSDANPGPIVLPAAKGSHRNFRLRISPSSIQEPIAPPVFSTGDMTRRSVISSSQQSSRLPTDHSLDIRSAPVLDNASLQNPNVAVHVPTLPRNVQSFRWNGGSGSRTGNTSSSNISGDRHAVPHEGHQLRSMARNLLDHPMFVRAPELRTLVRNPMNRDVNSGNLSVPGNFASTSRAGSSSGANASSVPTWAPQPNHPSQYPRRLSGLVRRQLMSSLGPESGGPGNHPSLQYRRLMSLLERQDAGFLAVPHSLRNLAAATEGRSRLVVPEIRNVLDLMRRGENLRFEDAVILDQSAFFGAPDIHDRHRDMRLDVDNMSYEELLALEERIGNVNTGLSEEMISNQLKRRKYSSVPETQLETEPCCVCQEEYNDGEDLGTLKCGHDFHADCIKQWLISSCLQVRHRKIAAWHFSFRTLPYKAMFLVDDDTKV
ncbi:E3 ubiquitin ligase BIG BROTHER [Gossypium arboreum]|uniref:RING-type E3 ubiquitin transferase n=1 Tax=Gossypium arboreum TaxID=29729 RepID=A0A0B0PW03_GOSAR|nr:E3 ubiquitin ligase BIG BROTHER [Gossypium arboreum]